MEKEFFSSTEVAQLLGISRIAVFKKIKSGVIKAEKIGRNFVIRREEIPQLLKKTLNSQERKAVEQSVKRTVQEYRHTLELLGKE